MTPRQKKKINLKIETVDTGKTRFPHKKKASMERDDATEDKITASDPSPVLCIGGVLRPSRLLAITKELRELVIANASRIKGFKPIADALGAIETRIVDSEGLSKVEKHTQDCFL